MAILINAALTSRTVRLQYRNGPASGLYFSTSGFHFVLTAAHVAERMQAGDHFQVRFKKDWVSVKVRDVEFDSLGFDVCAILPETQWGEGLSEDDISPSLLVGEEIAFVGFPLNLEWYATDGELGWPTGLVKSGVYSGSVPRPEDGKFRYFFDAFNNVGFSGGPIVVNRSGRIKVAALVSEYKRDRELNLMKRDPSGQISTDKDYFVAPNSGFMVGIPIQLAVDAAKRIAARQIHSE